MLAAPSQVFAQAHSTAKDKPVANGIVESANQQAAALAAQSIREAQPAAKRGWISTHPTGTGALIGFGAGAAIGGVRCATSGTCDVTPGRAALTAGIFGAGIGAMIGMAKSIVK